MKSSELNDQQKLTILILKYAKVPQDAIREDDKVRCRQKKVGDWLKEFNNMTWEEAQAFVGHDYEYLLRLRPDYIDRKRAEAELEEDYMWGEIRTLRMELGLPFVGIGKPQR